MANTTIKGNIIQITDLDADWYGNVDANMHEMKISSIQFNPSATDDIMIIHDGSLDGATLFKVKCVDTYDQRIKYFDPPIWANPVIDISDCTIASPINAEVIIVAA